ncbi:AGE family epimerase/isomerase [Caldicellulosiruptor acetigenus]|uniref:AGE family epimerase/isomerase n=1 Tax=Caldicellulosiruptor acetigenus TaxID=301953 RepID=UPI00041A8BB5|nr:AGE family epimerase/isomerase [Caldicellulosiruptor acetigenus]WAM36510.1 AGE family epimerase/isomerase [Caldicellulosiruptor acetigenus]
MDITRFKEDLKSHLEEKIIPFWQSLKDDEFGGYYGYMDFNLNINREAQKGCILNSRILWFFSACYNILKDEKSKELAFHAFEFLKNKFWDKDYEGLFWMVSHKGVPVDVTKHVYVQAFGIYGLSEYYEASGDEEALHLAKRLFEILETKCKRENGYTEQFERNWQEKENRFLSENGVIASKTMNTHLHVLESYTNLYRVLKLDEVYEALEWIVRLFVNKIYKKGTGHFKAFCDDNWNELIRMVSYGHDIEASWLLDEAAKYLKDENLKKQVEDLSLELAEVTLKEGFDGKSLINEMVEDRVDRSKIWWVEAETVVGFFNAYQKSKEEKFLDAAIKTWEFIKEYLVDKRKNSEWLWKVSEDLKALDMPIVEPWKCPYHNGRMCLEIIKRVG